MQVIRNNIDITPDMSIKTLMIHCVCNNINSQAIARAVRLGARTADGVQQACGGNFNCGMCRNDIETELMRCQMVPIGSVRASTAG